MTGPATSRWLAALLTLFALAHFPIARAEVPPSDTSPTSATDTWVPFKATYIAVMNGTTVDSNGVRELEYLGNQKFRYRAVAENLLFKFEEVTDFRVEQGKVYPLQYQSERSNPFQTRKKAIGYNWENNTAHYQYKDKKGTLQLEGRVLDPLTAVFELAREVKVGNSKIHFQEVGSRKVKDRHFTVMGEETIELPYGKIKTLRLRMLDDDDKETLIWLAPEKNHLAVKVEQNEDGEEYKLELKSYSPRKPVHLKFEKPGKETNGKDVEVSSKKSALGDEPPPEPGDSK